MKFSIYLPTEGSLCSPITNDLLSFLLFGWGVLAPGKLLPNPMEAELILYQKSACWLVEFSCAIVKSSKEAVADPIWIQ